MEKQLRSLPKKDIVSWNGVICGFAQNGGAAKALQLFDELVQVHHKEVMPDHVTFVGVLTASCSHPMPGLSTRAVAFSATCLKCTHVDPKPS